jgi:double-stranded RNA-specific adenosine deaminase
MKPSGVRSAEADRIASCAFADKVAQCSLDFSTRHCPAELRASYKQTVVAAILVRSEDITGKVTLRVVSMGVGTKVLPYADVAEQRCRPEGSVLIRDCHAEVLARRGFVRFLYDQLTLSNTCTPDSTWKAPVCVFEQSGTGLQQRLKLKKGVTFHLYTSSQPCGNASIKRWAKCKPLQFDPSLHEDEYPRDAHSRIQITEAGRKEGQVALLVKRNNNHPTAETSAADGTPEQLTQDAVFSHSMCTFLPDTALATPHVPVGTALATSCLGNVMTCSDKIARWNALGLQGSLLSALMEPVYLSTITVGRKFTKAHCERALCCRLQDFCYPPPARKTGARKRPAAGDPVTSMSSAEPLAPQLNTDVIVRINAPEGSALALTAGHEAAQAADERDITTNPPAESSVVYRMQHPVMLSTSVKLDEGAIVTGSVPEAKPATEEGLPAAERTRAVTVGANFDEPRCVCCYVASAPAAAFTEIEATMQERCVVEVIDGRTGLLVPAAAVGGDQSPALSSGVGATAEESGKAESARMISSVCSQELRRAYLNLVRDASLKDAGEEVGKKSYAAWKREASAAEHVRAKEYLLSESSLFAQWITK